MNSEYDDGRPMNTDMFLVELMRKCDDRYDMREAIKAWIEGAWDDAMSYMDDTE